MREPKLKEVRGKSIKGGWEGKKGKGLADIKGWNAEGRGEKKRMELVPSLT